MSRAVIWFNVSISLGAKALTNVRAFLIYVLIYILYSEM